MKISSFFRNLSKFYKMIQKDHPKVLIYVFIGGIAKGIIPFISLFYSSRILDSLLESNIDAALPLIMTLLISTFVLGCIDRACYQTIQVISEISDLTVWKQTTHKAFILEYEEFEKTETMDKIRRAQNGSNSTGGIGAQIENTYSLVYVLTSVIFSVVLTMQLLVKNMDSMSFLTNTLILLLGFVTFVLSSSIIQKKLNEFGNETWRKNEHGNSISSYFFSACLDIKNGKDIRLFAMKDMMLNQMDKINLYVNSIFKDYAFVSAKSNSFIAFMTQILAGCIYIYVGISVLEGVISIGSVVLYAGSITNMTNSVTDLIGYYNDLAFRFEYLANFEEFISSKNMHYDGTLPIEKRDDYEYEFEFKNVSFKYPNTDNYVLKNINLKLNVNKRFAIVGQNGAGKTTLIKLLCRLYEPCEGEILLNGINIEKYDYEEYTSVFSVVFQDFKLFPLPLDQNIAGSEDVNEERCLEVLEQVGLKEKVMNWSDKHKTRLYKNLGDGINVSGGEAQKIAIARALYKDAPFVIMDEPTAALDPIAESEIYENFNEMIHDKTAIFISHRMSSCKFCDEIIVFKDGEIAQQGSHNELVEKDGLYQELWNAQAQYYA